MSARPLIVIAGIGNASGTGFATARVFSKAGYRVALIARNAEALSNAAKTLNQEGGEAASFPVSEYSWGAITNVFKDIKAYKWPSSDRAELRVALWNAGTGVWKGFLDITEQEVQSVIDSTIVAPWAFSREVLLTFQQNEIDNLGKRGTLLFTGATASWRGNTTTSAFAAGKFALRALSQSLNKEFGKQNIHVAHSIIDGGILTDRSAARLPDAEAHKAYVANTNVRLSAESIGKAYLYLAGQDNSAWTWELDLRPAHEKW